MGLGLTYIKGKSFKSSFFVAKEGTGEYKVTAAEVIPLVVQSAIQSNDPDVISPEAMLSELKAKYTTLSDFKRWAKRRKSKNKRAIKQILSMNKVSHKDPEVNSEIDGRNTMPNENDLTKVASEDKVTETPVAEQKAEVAPAEVVEAVVETPAAAEVVAPVETEVTEIKSALNALLKAVEAKLTTKAVKIESVKPVVDGVGKSSVAPMPKGISEVVKTETPKGHVSAALKVEAMDENWSVNEKELDSAPKKEKPGQGMPVHMSVDSKELSAEQMKVKPTTKSQQAVKKYYNELGPGATGEAPMSVDVKSAQNAEVKLLREALAKANAENQAILEKERMHAVADKIFNVVASLKEKHLLSKAKEELVVDTLTSRFATVEAIDGIKTVIDSLEASPVAKTEETMEEQKVVPQIELENADTNTDAVSLLSSVWND